jgi:hypothetical protein
MQVWGFPWIVKHLVRKNVGNLACRQRHELIAPIDEKPIGTDDKGSGSPLKRRVDLGFSAGIQNKDLLSQSLRCLSNALSALLNSVTGGGSGQRRHHGGP